MEREYPRIVEPSPAFRAHLLLEIPRLRAVAISFCRSRHLADDLVQDTLLKAWSHADSFVADANFRGWLYTILRNTHRSIARRRGREVQDTDGIHANGLAVGPEQHAALDLADLMFAMSRLPSDQREALLLVGAAGSTYAEAAESTGVAVGTIKSRVNRGRLQLAAFLDSNDPLSRRPIAPRSRRSRDTPSAAGRTAAVRSSPPPRRVAS